MKKILAIVVIVALGFSMYYYLAFQQLSYEIEVIAIDNVGLLNASLTVFLRANNPNLLPLYLATTTFDLYLNGDYAGHGSTASAIIVGYSYHTIQAPITIIYTGLSAGVMNIILIGGSVNVDIRGDASLLFIKIPFEISDTFTMIES